MMIHCGLCDEPLRLLKIEADFTDPIWCDNCGANLELEDFPLSDHLIEELLEWVRAWEKVELFYEEGLISYGEKINFLKAHDQQGLQLTEKVQQQMGKDIIVRYFSVV